MSRLFGNSQTSLSLRLLKIIVVTLLVISMTLSLSSCSVLSSLLEDDNDNGGYGDNGNYGNPSNGNSNNNSSDSNNNSSDSNNSNSAMYTSSTTYLPNPETFFNNQISAKWATHDDDKTLRETMFTVDIDDMPALMEYLNLFDDSRFNLQGQGVYDSDYIRSQALYISDYVFDYVGSNNLRHVETYYYSDHVSQTLEGNLIVALHTDYLAWVCKVYMEYPDDFEMIDTGDRCTQTVSDYTGMSTPTSSHDSRYSYGQALECEFCRGKGDCVKCDGYGKLYSIATQSDKKVNCYACGTSGKCRYCGGTGKRFN